MKDQQKTCCSSHKKALEQASSCCGTHKEDHVCCKSTASGSSTSCCSSKTDGTTQQSSETESSSSSDEDPPASKEPTPSIPNSIEIKPFYVQHIYFTLFFSAIVLLMLYFYSSTVASFIVLDILQFQPKMFITNVLLFFVANVPSILALTALFMFPIAFLRSFIEPQKIRGLLTTKYLILGNILASLLGAVAPFCSCSAIPLFIVFITSGIPLGVTLSFLLSAPLVHEVAVVLSLSLLGVPITILYVTLGISISVIVGYIMGKMNLERFIESWVHEAISAQEEAETKNLTVRERILFGIEETVDVLRNIYLYVILGIGIGAFIRFAIDANGLAPYLGKDIWYSVPLAVLAGIPMYAGAPTMVPIIHTLLDKGVGVGTALVFMMSTTALSLPSAILLRRVLKLPLLLTFFAIVTIGFIIIGYILNYTM